MRIITAEHAKALAIPERAAFRRNNQWMVFAVRDGLAKMVPISVGLENDEWVEVAEGLKKGDILVAEPANELEDGTAVTDSGSGGA